MAFIDAKEPLFRNALSGPNAHTSDEREREREKKGERKRICQTVTGVIKVRVLLTEEHTRTRSHNEWHERGERREMKRREKLCC